MMGRRCAVPLADGDLALLVQPAEGVVHPVGVVASLLRGVNGEEMSAFARREQVVLGFLR